MPNNYGLTRLDCGPYHVYEGVPCPEASLTSRSDPPPLSPQGLFQARGQGTTEQIQGFLQLKGVTATYPKLFVPERHISGRDLCVTLIELSTTPIARKHAAARTLHGHTASEIVSAARSDLLTFSTTYRSFV
jgi:hypothetical protein